MPWDAPVTMTVRDCVVTGSSWVEKVGVVQILGARPAID